MLRGARKAALVFLSALTWGCGDDPSTGLQIIVDTSYPVPDELGHVDARIETLDGSDTREFSLDSRSDLPLAFFVSGDGAQAPSEVRIMIEARSRRGGRVLSQREAVVEFVRGKVLALPLFLARHCSWTPSCPSGQTCTEVAACASYAISMATLEPWDASEPLQPLPFDADACGPPCAEPTCGDGDANPGEVCDDGNRRSGDGCRADCAGRELCGDGIVDQAAAVPEQCDDGNARTERCAYEDESCVVCDARCRLAPGDTSFCGDRRVQGGDGELCDDGNTRSGDGCRGDCRSREVCGDGVTEAALGEQCDDGNAVDCDGCHRDCRRDLGCGDGVVCEPEACDPGEDPQCRADCEDLRVCGDGTLDPDLGEECDNGDAPITKCFYGMTSCSVCSDKCRQIAGEVSFCGDGVLDAEAGERCDWQLDAGCRADCTRCGDGMLDAVEDCDEGGAWSATCSSACVAPLFFDDVEASGTAWDASVLAGDPDVANWRRRVSSRSASGVTAWYSGAQPSANVDGHALLWSPEIDVSEARWVRIAFQHYHAFDMCSVAGSDFDGGFVEVFRDGTITRVAPTGGDTFGSCGAFEDVAAFSGVTGTGDFELVELDVNVANVNVLRIGFHARWDCAGSLTCGTVPEPDGWSVDDIGVVVLE